MTMIARAPAGEARLMAEFAALFFGAPLLMALALPPGWLFPMLFLVTAIGIALLQMTPGFHWRDLMLRPVRPAWPVIAAFAVVTLAMAAALMLVFAPRALLALPLREPALWLTILVLYPLLSALPQELVFRVLFFRRYGAILPAGLRARLLLNAGVFALAHLMYWNWVAPAMTFAGGLIFAWVYERRRDFPLAFALHAVAGWIVFTLGLGLWFYSGNAVRPF